MLHATQSLWQHLDVHILAFGAHYTSWCYFIEEFTGIDLLICPLILVNTALVGVEIDNTNADNKQIWLIVNSIWNIIWFLEMCLKIHCLGSKVYFYSQFNRLDFGLLWLGIVDTWILQAIPGAMGSRLSGWAQWIRMVRVWRLVRFMRMFEGLWHIIDGFIKALSPLSWTLLLMLILNYTAASYMTVSVGHLCDTLYSEWSSCDDHFGTVPRSMWSLVQVMTFDSWSSGIARNILKQRPLFFFFFMMYIIVLVFGLLNILVGIIVESTFESRRDLEREQLKCRLQGLIENITSIFQSTDNDANGTIDFNEFRKGLASEDINLHDMFHGLGLNINADAQAVFNVLDDTNSGFINIEQFVEGILNLNNPPTRLDCYSSAIKANEEFKNELITSVERLLGKESTVKLGRSSLTTINESIEKDVSSIVAPCAGEKSDSGNTGRASTVLQSLEVVQRGFQDAQIVQQQALESLHRAKAWLIQNSPHIVERNSQNSSVSSSPPFEICTTHEERDIEEQQPMLAMQSENDQSPMLAMKSEMGTSATKTHKVKVDNGNFSSKLGPYHTPAKAKMKVRQKGKAEKTKVEAGNSSRRSVGKDSNPAQESSSPEPSSGGPSAKNANLEDVNASSALHVVFEDGIDCSAISSSTPVTAVTKGDDDACLKTDLRGTGQNASAEANNQEHAMDDTLEKQVSR
eukprot:gnl/MRDRNA2_/MRDRNA2_80825_c0_seq2.p1 gnl/MRDRNA2_/MRDRNA2_80825_c0~~gnl/MRDRNA2_/MRDRNA2_80825_c0_seq2.p1  ORF type:complete len:688 (+),score=108.52 gnl/MRDRNA2_/MRDRNA2_80825_c0_seq2:399-2462(+)